MQAMWPAITQCCGVKWARAVGEVALMSCVVVGHQVGSKWLSGSGALALRSACNINKQARRIGEKKYPPSLFEVRLLTGPGGDCMCLEQLLATYDPP